MNKFAEYEETTKGWERLRIILKLHKEGNIDDNEAIDLISGDKNFYTVKEIHTTPPYNYPYTYSTASPPPSVYGNYSTTATVYDTSTYDIK